MKKKDQNSGKKISLARAWTHESDYFGAGHMLRKEACYIEFVLTNNWLVIIFLSKLVLSYQTKKTKGPLVRDGSFQTFGSPKTGFVLS